MSTDFLSEHPEKKFIIKKLQGGQSPRQVSNYLQEKYPEHPYLHVDVKTLSKVAEKFAQKKPKQKQWFSVTVEAIAPVTVQFRVFAEDEEKAFEAVERAPHLTQMDGRPQIDFRRMQKRRVSIKNLMTGMINWVRKF